MKVLNSQIIDLTKHIFLSDQGEGSARSQFMAGKEEPFGFTGRTIITWWYTKKTFELVDNISFILMQNFDEFSDCDLESLNDLIKKTLCEVCADKQLFNMDLIFFTDCNNLFESRATNNIEFFSSSISSKILKKIKENLISWSVIYSAPRLSGNSFVIPSAKIHVLQRHDEIGWNNLHKLGYSTINFDPQMGAVKGLDSKEFFIPSFNYYFVTEEFGTSKGCKFSSSLKIKMLFSVIFAVISKNQKGVLMKSSADPQTLSLQFPHESSNLNFVTRSSIGELLPYYMKDYPLSTKDIAIIIEWYEDLSNLDIDSKNKIKKCAHFINQAMNSNGMESFTNYFISLDALLGKRYSVEKSIVSGVSKLDDAYKWKEKISWLFELRSELVHGGSRYIEEWPKYHKYYRHFSSEPLKDIEKLAFSALLYSPKFSSLG